MKLVDNWKSSWKWYSTHMTLANGAVLGSWTQFPDDLKGRLPHYFIIYVALALLVLTFSGRLIDQSKMP